MQGVPLVAPQEHGGLGNGRGTVGARCLEHGAPACATAAEPGAASPDTADAAGGGQALSFAGLGASSLKGPTTPRAASGETLPCGRGCWPSDPCPPSARRAAPPTLPTTGVHEHG